MTTSEILQFINLNIRHAEKRIEFFDQHTNLDTLYDFFRVQHVESKGYKSTKEIVDVLRARLKKRISVMDSERLREEIVKTKKYSLYLHLKFNTVQTSMWRLVGEFSNNMRPASDNMKNRNKPISWFRLSQIILLTVWIKRLDSLEVDYFEMSKHTEQNLWRYALNVLYIEKYVPQAIIDNGILMNQKEVEEILFSRIESRIKRYGPIKFLEYIIGEYKKSFDSTTKEFKPSDKARKFLYHLALKSVTSPDIEYGKGNPQMLEFIESIANVLLTLSEFKIENQFQLMFLNVDPVKYFQKAVYSDSLFRETQYPPESTLMLLDNMLESYREECNEIIGVDKESIILISETIITMAIQSFESSESVFRFSADELISKLHTKIPSHVIITYLNRLTSRIHLNSDFNHPFEIVNINSDSQWLIPVPNLEFEYFLPLPSINCLGLYDTIKDLLGHPQSWGIVFEQFIQQWLEKCLGEKVYSGKYIYNGKEAESDGICIVDNHVIILESKIKPLTRAARSGHIGKLLLDLGGSVIDSQHQAYRLESALRGGPLCLFDSNCDLKSMLKGTAPPIAHIEAPPEAVYIRLSITPFNYGVFSQKIVLQNIFSALIKYSFETDDPEIKSRFKTFEKKRRSLLTTMGQLQKVSYHPERIHEMTHHSHFMSFGLLYILTSSKITDKSIVHRFLSLASIQSSDYNTSCNTTG